jgi:acyl-CoA thioester hydrolase
VIHQVRVIFGDTDQMGIVYYANYLRYFESARAALLRARGFSARALIEQGVMFPVTEASCRYRRPARFEDLLDVHTAIVQMGHVRVRFEYSVRRDDELVAEGHTVHACLDPSGRPRRIPAELRAAFATGG